MIVRSLLVRRSLLLRRILRQGVESELLQVCVRVILAIRGLGRRF